MVCVGAGVLYDGGLGVHQIDPPIDSLALGPSWAGGFFVRRSESPTRETLPPSAMGRGQSATAWPWGRVRFDRINATPSDPPTPPPADGDP